VGGFAQPARKIHPALWALSFVMALLAAWMASDTGRAAQYQAGVLFLWLGSMALFIFAGGRSSFAGALSGVESQIRTKWKELLGLTIILALAFTLRTMDLGMHPYPFVNDEAEMGKVAQCILSGRCRNLFETGWAFQSKLAFVPTALSVWFFGNTVFAVRIVSALLGTMAVACAYLLARELFGLKMAFASAFLATVFPYHIHFSRLGVDNIIDSLTSGILLWLTFRATRSGAAHWYILIGLISGLCLYTYPGSWLSPLLALAAFFLIGLRSPGLWKSQRWNIVLALLMALITIAPLAGYYTTNTSSLMGRVSRESLLAPGALTLAAQNEKTGIPETLIIQMLKSILVFLATPAPLQFFNSPRAYLTSLAAVFFVFGLVRIATRVKDSRYASLLLWFFAPVLLGSALTIGAPSNQRMLGASMAAVIITALGLLTILDAFAQTSQFFKRAGPHMLLVILLLVGTMDIQYYFGEYRDGRYYGDPSDEISYEFKTTLATLKSDPRVYIIGAPSVFAIFGNFGYFSPGVEMLDFNEVTSATLAKIPKDKAALFLATPMHRTEIEKIVDWLPGGVWEVKLRLSFPDQVLYYSYQLTREQLQAFQP
jgi:hypothetical protein